MYVCEQVLDLVYQYSVSRLKKVQFSFKDMFCVCDLKHCESLDTEASVDVMKPT